MTRSAGMRGGGAGLRSARSPKLCAGAGRRCQSERASFLATAGNSSGIQELAEGVGRVQEERRGPFGPRRLAHSPKAAISAAADWRLMLWLLRRGAS